VARKRAPARKRPTQAQRANLLEAWALRQRHLAEAQALVARANTMMARAIEESGVTMTDAAEIVGTSRENLHRIKRRK
jgi:hypothetical protein